MDYHTHIFSELRIFKDMEVYVGGEAEIKYKWRKAQPDVGIMSPWVDFEVGKIWIHPSTEEGKIRELPYDHYLYKKIYCALTHPDYHDYIEEELDEAYVD